MVLRNPQLLGEDWVQTQALAQYLLWHNRINTLKLFHYKSIATSISMFRRIRDKNVVIM